MGSNVGVCCHGNGGLSGVHHQGPEGRVFRQQLAGKFTSHSQSCFFSFSLIRRSKSQLSEESGFKSAVFDQNGDKLVNFYRINDFRLSLSLNAD